MADDPPSFSRAVADNKIVIRDTDEPDFETIQIIYAHEVLHGLATFEEVPPPIEELKARHAAVKELGLPYLTAELEGQVVGYGYTSPFRPRVAYRYTIEDSVYVAQGMQGNGIGQALLSSLIERCEAGPWRQMIAVIGDTDNAGSIALHRKLDFHQAGTLHKTGFKLGRWVDTVLMQRALGSGGDTPAER